MLLENQATFKKGKSTLDNIFILNHLVQGGEDMDRSEEKVYAFFADLRAAFDNVNRGILWRTLREKGVDDGLIRRIEMIYEETVVTVRMNQGISREFKTKEGDKDVF